jgi:phosphatidylethanolamine-binding protein (PEBP) family uncharacterized protein
MSAQQQERGGGAGRAGGGGRGGRGGGFNLPPLLMQTDAFPDGGIVPQKFAGRGGVQPGFKFSGAPDGTTSYAIIFHDIDVSLQTASATCCTGWRGTFRPPRAEFRKASSPRDRYRETTSRISRLHGPGAPAGPRYHHYVFELYALNANLDIPATASRDDLLKAMAGKIVAKAAYVGRYRSEPAQ